jgi:hypothetical protein
MRQLLIFAIVALATAACQRTAEQEQADQARSHAEHQGALIQSRADSEADQLQQQASELDNQANQAGGMTGERLKVRAEALKDEAKIIRKQADKQADAIRESADAQIKETESR